MAGEEPDPDYMMYLRAMNDPEFAQIYLQEPGEFDPDYVVDVSDEEENEEEEDDDEEEEEEEESDDSSVEVLHLDVPLARAGEDRGATTSSQGVSLNNVQVSGNATAELGKPSQKRSKEAETNDKEEISVGEEWDRHEVDGLYCPICMEAWSSGGDHQVCCLPCGHIYGSSCIKKWLQQSRSQGKCPQCNTKCTLKSIRVLYASRIVVIDEELQKKVQTLEAKCASLEKKDGDWRKKEDQWQKREADLCMQVDQLRERTCYLEGLLGDVWRRPSGLVSAAQDCQGHSVAGTTSEPGFGQWGCLKRFSLLNDWQIDGARFFDVDAYGKTVVIARGLSGMGGPNMLTKISLLAPHERENIQLPLSIKVVKDLHISPHARLALLASLGKKLSVISFMALLDLSNSTVLTYDLLSAAWSCAWDLNNSHYVYTGLQSGMVLEFDLRQTQRPVESMTGLTGNPVHTIRPLSSDSTLASGKRSVLTASSVGLCHWNFGSGEERPFLVPESGNQGVCISLAYGTRSGNIVASFRPKIEMAGDASASQTQPTLSSPLLGQGVQGSHVLYKITGSRYDRLGSSCANVSNIRLPKSALIDSVNCKSLFVSVDEVTCGLVLQELPSFLAFQRLNIRKSPIRDVKYSDVLKTQLLGCLSEHSLQLFSTEHS